MSDSQTVPRRMAGMPVRGLRLEVTTGPDRGLCHSTDADAVTIGTAESNDLTLSDATVSRFHLSLQRTGVHIKVIDHGSTNGTLIGPALLRGGSVAVQVGTVIGLGDTSLRIDDGRVSMVEEGPDTLGLLRGSTPTMRRLLASIERIARLDVPVLIAGESGTGKELIAQSLHERSLRRDGPLVTVDCGALSPTLFASELFGHERGAFTGAHRRHIGAFERAHGGTLFRDEIGELTHDLQSALLGAMERRRIRRLGGDHDVTVDARILAATHRDLRAAVNSGSFRLDLFYRIAVVTLDVPPLRERLDDIPVLIDHFLHGAGYSGQRDDVFPVDVMRQLRSHDWPGNVRELRNIVLGTLASGETPELGTSPTEGLEDQATVDSIMTSPYREARRRVLDDFERRYLRQLLERAHGNIRRAARDASMDRSYLMELLKRHGLR